MRVSLALFILSASAFSTPAQPAEPTAAVANSPHAQNTDDRTSIDRFAASAIITSDVDWAKKWEKRGDTIPEFSLTDKMKLGERATLLVFFENPKPNANGAVDVTFDLRIIRPNSKETVDRALKGFSGALPTPATQTYLTKTTISFVGEKDDPLGDWLIEITVHDNVRGKSVLLKSHFLLSK